MGFFEAVIDTLYEWESYTQNKKNVIPGTWYQLLASHFDLNREGRWEDGRGGPRGSTLTVRTLDNAMPCHRTGYFKHYIPTLAT